MSTIAENLDRIRKEIEERAMACGRRPEEIRVVAVSKKFPAGSVRSALESGQVIFGENRVQEAAEKIPEVDSERARWHLIGHLQSNKARLALEIFDLLETLDSEKLARRLDRLCRRMNRVFPVLIQVNIGEEEQKSGVLPGEVARLVEVVDSLSSLELRGLMGMPPYSEEAEESRPYFRRLWSLFEDLNRGRESSLTELSMGMSGDYGVAVEEGATLLRLGTAIFGPRS